jgi:hypothetical protein
VPARSSIEIFLAIVGYLHRLGAASRGIWG